METMTIRDIAKKCKVGVSTVSRAINNHPDINEETKERIMSVIRENNYIPNNSARNLKRVNAQSIAVLVKGITNPFFSDMINIIERETQKKKYSFILQRVEESEDELDAAIELVKEKRLKGIVFLGGYFSHTEEHLRQLDVPFVLSTVGLVDEPGRDLYSSVSVDDRRESKKMVDYLLSLGHERIAILAARESDVSIGRLRYLGYTDALAAHQIEVDPALVRGMHGVNDRYSMETGYRLTHELLRSGEEFTALYCIADSLAIGACRAIAEAGRQIPEDYSVAGFDGISIGAYYTPSLTTIRQPVEDMAIATTQALFDAIRHKGHRRLLFDGELLVRESTRKR